MNFIKNALTNNIGLKLAAFLFAVVLWIIVVNVDDPSQSKTFTTNVQLINEELLTDQGKYYNIPENGNTVSFRVSAKRSIMERLTASDFTATADFNNLENDTRIPVEIVANRYTSSVGISGNQKYIYLEIGEEMEQKFVISGDATGNPADGFAVGDISVKPNVMTISGPSELVAQVDHVEALCDVSGMNTDITESVVPTILNSSGDVVDTTKLKLSETTVKVSVQMLSVKRVGVDIATRGELPEGLSLKSISLDPESIMIMGSSEAINGITSIIIPDDVIDLSTVTGSVETTVDIRAYLPDGVSLANGSRAQIVIKIEIDEDSEDVLNIPTANLTIQNLSPEYIAEFTNANITVKVSGTQSLLDAIEASEVAGYVDASGLTEGSHTVTVTLNLDEGITASAATAQIEITLREKPQDEAGESAPDTPTPTQTPTPAPVTEEQQTEEETGTETEAAPEGE